MLSLRLLCVAVLALPLFVHAQSIPSPSALPPAVSTSRIALLHMVNDVWFFQDLASTTKRNKKRYAARHGYEMVVHDKDETSGLFLEAPCGTPGAHQRPAALDSCFVPRADFSLDKRAPTFGKIKLALAACVGRPDYWLLWTDADAMIFNQVKSLLDVVDDAFDIIVASDWFMINAGVLLMRCSDWNIDFLQRIYDAREFDSARALDQSAIASFIAQDEAKAHVKHVPKWLINGTHLRVAGDSFSPCLELVFECFCFGGAGGDSRPLFRLTNYPGLFVFCVPMSSAKRL